MAVLRPDVAFEHFAKLGHFALQPANFRHVLHDLRREALVLETSDVYGCARLLMSRPSSFRHKLKRKQIPCSTARSCVLRAASLLHSSTARTRTPGGWRRSRRERGRAELPPNPPRPRVDFLR